MSVSKVQAIVSILVVFSFLLVSAIIALAPILGGYPASESTPHLQAWGALYSGIVGLIIGYYFPKPRRG
ncbi:hypothetical protein [Ferrimonas balearica]|uniref:hypothetical protein n=1 Tax=Ferrimonas balearica TaxID=44012 RepID=UPI001C969B01|nr:hypothetical protein [Ferrimonas balearica]MBY6223160.1 hypothetical protein [Ferrimonas balearica]